MVILSYGAQIWDKDKDWLSAGFYVLERVDDGTIWVHLSMDVHCFDMKSSCPCWCFEIWHPTFMWSLRLSLWESLLSSFCMQYINRMWNFCWTRPMQNRGNRLLSHEIPKTAETLISSYLSRWSILLHKWLDSFIIFRPCKDFGFQFCFRWWHCTGCCCCCCYHVWIAGLIALL